MKNKVPMIFAAAVLVFAAGAAAGASETVRVYVNGNRVDTDAVIINDRTYIPLRAVSEAMGAQVGWDGDTYTASVDFTEDDAVAQIVSDTSPSVTAVVGNKAGAASVSSLVHGTGVVIRSNGMILTNAHVVKDIANTTVILYDGTSLPAQVLYSDDVSDLAILKIDKIGLKPIKMADSSSIAAGKTAIAIGNPISLSMRNSVTKGVVSIPKVEIPGSYYKLIQTDAAINPGNSGGPLLNMKGEMIGINSSGYVSTYIENVSFAIPVDTVEYIVNCYEKNGGAVRADMHMELEQSREAALGLPTQKGLTVKSSSNGIIAAGDVVNAVNGISVHSTADVNEVLKDTYTGGDVLVTYTRGGEQYTAAVPASGKN